MQLASSTELRADRRVRRTDDVSRAIAYQCAHVQQRYDLEAVVLADDSGDHWVGAGDKRLCRLLSRSAATLASGRLADIDYRLKTLQGIRADLTLGELTTYAIRVPGSDRFLYVSGVGTTRERSNGVERTVRGARRILGYDRAPQIATDPDALLNHSVTQAWEAWRWATPVPSTPAARTWWGGADDHAYAPILQQLLEPAIEILVHSGVVVDDPWKRWRWTAPERRESAEVFVRTLTATVREPRSMIALGALTIELAHRHDRIDVPRPPRVRLTWSQGR